MRYIIFLLISSIIIIIVNGSRHDGKYFLIETAGNSSGNFGTELVTGLISSPPDFDIAKLSQNSVSA